MLEQSIKKVLESISFNTDYLSPSEWIEKNRYIQEHVSERMFGKFDWSNVPYMKQITDHLSQYDPVTHIALMKGVRIGGTFALVHNGVPYIMSERPTNIMLLSANDTLATSTLKGVDDGIDGCNIRHLVGKTSGARSKSTGDTLEQKIFNGGYELFNFGGQSIKNMRQKTAGFVAADELDAFKGIDKIGGSFLKAMEDRARSFGEAKKIVYISSPLLLISSLIYKLYLQGNQNVYYLPCPQCGEYIELVWNERNINNTRYGVVFDVRNGEVIEKSVRYRCGKCENEFFEKKYKRDMLNNGYWKESMERENKRFVSYRISALYAPPTMDNWYDFARDYQEAFPRGGTKDDAAYQTFENSILGWPYKPIGYVLKTTELQKNRRDYKIGDCPFELSKKDNNGEIVIITLAAECNGYDSDPDYGDDARIDYEILGHSEKQVTYSADAGSCGTFIPKIELRALKKEGVDIGKLERARKKYSYKLDVENSVWDLLEEKIKQTFGTHERRIDVIAIDVGGKFGEYGMEFCKKMINMGYNVLPIKGANKEIFTGKEKNETARMYQMSEDGEKFLVNVNVIKDNLAKYILLKDYIDKDGQLHQPEHYLNFPEYDPKAKKYTYRNYFAHYESESRKEKKAEGMQTRYFWEKKRPDSQNHYLDTAVYNQFIPIYHADLICKAANDAKLANGKKMYSDKIEITWENTCRLIKEWYANNNLQMS
jgi:phage terminase large subunit GpA-like protein